MIKGYSYCVLRTNYSWRAFPSIYNPKVLCFSWKFKICKYLFYLVIKTLELNEINPDFHILKSDSHIKFFK